jgi:hypothetical protein
MDKSVMRTVVLGFIAGAIGVIIFHQGLIWILDVTGVLPISPYSLKPVGPFGVPQVLSLAFWGGIWGIALILVMEEVRDANRLWVAFMFGGILPPLVGILIVTPIKGGNVADWLEWRRILLAFLINAVWGLGTAIVYRFERRLAA